MPGICLNMIVKNEAKNIPRLFASIRDAVDYYVISDTGSTDDTIHQIEAEGLKYGIKGLVVSHPWVNFAHNRNLAMQAAKEARAKGSHDCDWLFIIDADEEFVVSDPEWKNQLCPDISYSLYKKINGLAFRHIFLVSLNHGNWEWEGGIHNYLVPQDPTRRKAHLNSVAINCHDFEGANSHPFNDPSAKAKRDIELLLQELQHEKISASNVQRFFQLGFAYKNSGDINKCLYFMNLVAHCETAAIDFRYYALILVAKSRLTQQSLQDDASEELEAAAGLDPCRAESYFYRAVLLRRQSKDEEAIVFLEKAIGLTIPEKAVMMLEESIYTWRIKYELAFLYYLKKDRVRAQELIDGLLRERDLPEIERKFILSLSDKNKDRR